MATNWSSIRGVVVCGHRVASVACKDPRFPGGTIALQKPVFKKYGLNLDRFHAGTINLSIAPLLFRLKQARYRFRNLRWTDNAPAEDFSFTNCRVLLQGGTSLEGLIYYPHPETKPEHFQAPDVLEILTYLVEGLTYGDRLIVELDRAQIELIGVDDDVHQETS
jgi:hypothetical protein